MKSIMKVLISLLVILVVIIISGLFYLFLALPETDEVQSLKVSSTPGTIERGRYLANHVAVCIDCHSMRDWQSFSGPIKPGTKGAGGDEFTPEMGFPGTFYGKNITPYGVGHWSDGELYRIITTGVTRDGKPVFPFMPFPTYSKMDPSDVMAIIAYLRTLPSIKNDVPASKPDFPFSLIMRTIPKPSKPEVRPTPDDTLNYGRYMTMISGCSDCHTPTKKGKPVVGMAFAGGQEYQLSFGILRSANITPDKTGIGAWTEEQFVLRFKMYDNPNMEPIVVEPDEFNTVMPWTMYGGMETRDLKAIYKYLTSLEPIDNAVESFTLNE